MSDEYFTIDDMIAHIKKAREAYPSDVAFARAIGITPQYLWDVLNGNRVPGDKMMKPLGFKRVIAFKRYA